MNNNKMIHELNKWGRGRKKNGLFVVHDLLIYVPVVVNFSSNDFEIEIVLKTEMKNVGSIKARHLWCLEIKQSKLKRFIRWKSFLPYDI